MMILIEMINNFCIFNNMIPPTCQILKFDIRDQKFMTCTIDRMY